MGRVVADGRARQSRRRCGRSGVLSMRRSAARGPRECLRALREGRGCRTHTRRVRRWCRAIALPAVAYAPAPRLGNSDRSLPGGRTTHAVSVEPRGGEGSSTMIAAAGRPAGSFVIPKIVKGSAGSRPAPQAAMSSSRSPGRRPVVSRSTSDGGGFRQFQRCSSSSASGADISGRLIVGRASPRLLRRSTSRSAASILGSSVAQVSQGNSWNQRLTVATRFSSSRRSTTVAGIRAMVALEASGAIMKT